MGSTMRHCALSFAQTHVFACLRLSNSEMIEHGMVMDETFCGTSSPIDVAFQPIAAKK
jgi:hypothetical protein